jgi:AraC-like DNA-binding protein
MIRLRGAAASSRRGVWLYAMPKFRFSSDDLPPGLDEAKRLSLCRERHSAIFAFDSVFLDDRPLSVSVEFVQSDAVKAVRVHGTFQEVTRTRRHIAREPHDDLCISFNTGRSEWLLRQCGRENVSGIGQAILHTNAEPYLFRAESDWRFLGIGVSRQALGAFVAAPEDLVARTLNASAPAVQHLRSYVALAVGPNGMGVDPALDARIAANLLDLVALALGARGDAERLAQARGLRAARLQAVLDQIRLHAMDAAFSPTSVARRLCLSPRYIHDLLHETGVSFTERVAELRLQRARDMLASPRHDGLKVIDIAYACGFNEVSHFNRRFRARFGASPTQVRGRGNGADR